MRSLELFCVFLFCIAVSYSTSAQCIPSFVEHAEIGELSNISGRVADFDLDGNLDILLSNYVGTARVWFSDGNAQFTGGDEFGEISLAFKVLVNDFDADGLPDVFLASNGTPGRFWFNVGDGSFLPGEQQPFTSTGEAAAGDINLDGVVDLFCGWYADIENAVALNLGDGHFEFPDGGSTSLSRSVAIGDLDGDGDDDVLLAQGGFPNPFPNLILVNKSGVLELLNPTGFGLDTSSDVELADLDDDGDLDAVISNLSSDQLPAPSRVWLNDGSGNFSDSGQELGTAGALDVELSDIDADGDTDALFIEQSNNVQRVWLNDGAGQFVDSLVVSNYDNASQGMLGDFDGDGDTDIAIVTFAGTRILLNHSSQVGDVNGDLDVNLLDVGPFVQLIGNGQFQCEADINADGAVNLLDVNLFVELLLGD